MNLDSKAHRGLTEFEKINWLPINDRFEQCISSMTFKYFNYLTPFYMNDVFKLDGQKTTATRTSLFILSQPLQKTNHGQKSISYVAPSIWNKLPDFLKKTDNASTYIHRVKKHFFKERTMKKTISVATSNWFWITICYYYYYHYYYYYYYYWCYCYYFKYYYYY